MQSFKVLKSLNIEWLKNDSENGGTMELVIQSKADDHIILHSKTKKNGRMWSSDTPEQLLKVCNKDNGIYEVLSHFPQKVYFDIDCKTKQQIFIIKSSIK